MLIFHTKKPVYYFLHSIFLSINFVAPLHAFTSRNEFQKEKNQKKNYHFSFDIFQFLQVAEFDEFRMEKVRKSYLLSWDIVCVKN